MTYNVGGVNERNGTISNVINYLRGVSLARQSINRALPNLLRRANGVVVDIGGSGDLSEYVPPEFLVILDRIPSQFNALIADAAKTPFRPNSVARVLCISILEHADNPYEIILESKRILQPGGLLFISVPWLFESHMEPHDYWRFSVWQLNRWFETAALQIVSVEAVNDCVGLIAHILQYKSWTRWTIGLLCAIAHYSRGKWSYRYTTQLNYVLRKAVEDP
jgi:SAM-dependent methyltransferase